MKQEGSCANGSKDCDLSDMHELVLIEKIMRMIENYSKDKPIDPCPICLRNTMLAVAALLHLEAGKIDGEGLDQNAAKSTHFHSAFTEAARERLEAVLQIVASDATQLRRPQRLM
jgi:hypothetical protein